MLRYIQATRYDVRDERHAEENSDGNDRHAEENCVGMKYMMRRIGFRKKEDEENRVENERRYEENSVRNERHD